VKLPDGSAIIRTDAGVTNFISDYVTDLTQTSPSLGCWWDTGAVAGTLRLLGDRSLGRLEGEDEVLFGQLPDGPRPDLRRVEPHPRHRRTHRGGNAKPSAEALKAHPVKGLRDSIIHANLPTDHAIKVMADLQKTYDAGYPEAQAPFLWWIGDTYAGNLGPKRNPRLEPFQSYVKNGVIWAGGSDYYVTPYAARYGLWASVVRETQAGAYGKTPFGMAESVNIHLALKSYTIWAAHQMFLEHQVGSLEVGKDADIAVWDRNMYAIPSADLKNLQCEMTLVAGKVVFKR
jgi:hypothetical protein